MHFSHPSIQVLPDRIIKYFDDPVCYFREQYIYSLGLPITPRLLAEHSPKSLELELIHGFPYLDALMTFDPAKLGACIAGFHHATLIGEECHCHWDNNPKNILMCDGSYYLIDFSDCIVSYPESDLTHLLLFWIDRFDEVELQQAKHRFVDAYTVVSSLSISRWNDSIPYSYERFIVRRQKWGKPLSDKISSIAEITRLLEL